MADTEISIKILAQVQGVSQAVDQIRNSLEGLGSTASNLTGLLTGSGEALLGAFGAEKIGQFVESMAELGTEITRTMAITGLSSEQVGELRFAVEAAGGSVAGLDRAFAQMGRSVENAIAKTGNQRAAFDELGISTTFLKENQNNLQAILNAVADSLATHADGAGKDAIVMAALGRAGYQLLPVLNEGSDGLKRMAELAEETGTKLSSETVAGMHETHIATTTLGAAFQGLGVTIFDSFKPAIDATIRGLTDFVEGINNSIRQGGVLRYVLTALVTVFDVLVAATAAWSTAFQVAGNAIMAVMERVLGSLRTMGAIISDLIHGDFAKIQQDWDAGTAEMQSKWETRNAAMKASAQSFIDLLSKLNDGLTKLAGGSTALDAKDGGGGGAHGGTRSSYGTLDPQAIQQATKAAEEYYQFLKQMDSISLSDHKANWNAQVSAGKLAYTEMLQNVRDTLNEQFVAESAALEKIKTIKGQEPAVIEKVNHQIEELRARHNEALNKLAIEGEKNQEKADQQYLSWYKKVGEEELKLRQTQIEIFAQVYGLSAVQRIQMEKDAAEKTYENEKVILQKRLEGLVAYTDVAMKAWQELYDFEIKHSEEAAKKELEILKSQESEQQKLVDTISGYWDQFLSGLGQKGTTWQQEMAKIFYKMELSFIQSVSKMILEWLVLGNVTNKTPLGSAVGSLLGGGSLGGGGGNAATQALTTAIQGNTTATGQNTGGILNWVTQQLQSLAQWLGLTTATTTETVTTTGLIGSIATLDLDILGLDIDLLANSTALIANTAALYLNAASKTIPGFAEGTTYVPSTGLYRLHQGEIVIPSAASAAIRGGGALVGGDGGGGGGHGGGTVNINIHAMDSRDVIDTLQDPVVRRAVRGMWSQDIRNGKFSNLPSSLKMA